MLFAACLGLVGRSPPPPRAAARHRVISASATPLASLLELSDQYDAFLLDQDWDEARRAADSLERATRAEPLEWSDFYIRRARALAACGNGERCDATLTEELATLCEQAERVGRWAAVPALKSALSRP